MLVRSWISRQIVFIDAVVIITHPLLAAAAGGRGQAWLGAVPVRQWDVGWAEWDAAHHSVHAATTVLTVGLEVLAVLIESPIQLTRPTLSFRYKVKKHQRNLLAKFPTHPNCQPWQSKD